MSRYRAVGSGYPDWTVPGLTDEERAYVDRCRVTLPLEDPTRQTDAPTYRKPANPPTAWVSGMLPEEVTQWIGSDAPPG